MRCVSLVLLCLAAACASRAPIESAPAPIDVAPVAVGPAVALPCEWPVGTTVHYRYERRRLDSRRPGLEQVASVSPVVLTVTAADRLSLDIGATELTGPPELVETARAMLGGFDMPGMELVIKDGQLIDVANREALVSVILSQVQAMLPPETPPEAFESVKRLYADPQSATQLLLKEPQTLLGTLCMAMGDNQRIETRFESPGPMGGPTLQSIVTIDATIRPDEGTATYTLSTRTDPESLAALLEHTLKTMVPADGAPLPQMPTTDSSSVMVAVHSLSDGLPSFVDSTQTTVVGDNLARREDRWIWTRVTAP
ncbi:hypothetical protein L6R46_13830 [Myxococcota bacterium]|nr:hypothetical protein [Myxococcota bacterium]